MTRRDDSTNCCTCFVGHPPCSFCESQVDDHAEPVEMMTCQRCGGSGICSDCIDDLCNGGECIHGDDSTCRDCGGDGEVPFPPDPEPGGSKP